MGEKKKRKEGRRKLHWRKGNPSVFMKWGEKREKKAACGH